MSCKVTIVGGGSFAWTPTLATDLFLRSGLDGSELSLVDINQEAVREVRAYLDLVQKRIGSSWRISIDTLDDGLTDADYVCVSISTGGLEAMAVDYEVPERYGMYHAVGDTVGPGGIFRTLRNVPVFVDIAHRMERRCPMAWMIHVTNPLSQLTRVVCLESRIRCIGLCHNFSGTVSMLEKYSSAEVGTVHAESVGVNHFTWLKNPTVGGKPIELSVERYLDYFERSAGPVRSNTVDDQIGETLVGRTMEYYLNFHLYERFGYFPVGSSNHVAENLPFYCNDLDVQKKYHIRRKGVLPRRRVLAQKRITKIRAVLSGEIELDHPLPSNEGLSVIVSSLETGRPDRCIVSMPNQGQISNLPRDVIVETWAQIDGSGVHPVQSGDVPGVLTGMIETVIDEEEASVRAALGGDGRELVRALAVSPMVADKDCVEALASEMLDAHRSLLPQFFRSGAD